ncbi:MAG: DNA topoisomerase I [Bacteroidetes bacterium CG2_30_33_31]|nr:MAG: DNA topoisomerase I [Bacteroidetes bacterium CG2_30_33_31]
MSKNLVIVESPAKAKTIEKFLGKDFIVKSSFGHVRDLSKSKLGVEVENGFKPIYVNDPEKKKIITELKKLSEESEIVWLATDEDREGEAIAWHLKETLKLADDKIKRIVFHEITKDAILNAVQNPRTIDIDLVNAQQARRVLDRLVGFELSPLLWRKVMPSLSAGRVQSVSLRLIVEREVEIDEFSAEPAFKITGTFLTSNGEIIKAEISNRFVLKKDAEEFLKSCSKANFKISSVEKKPAKKTPPPPFTTSTLQQEAARKLGFSVAKTMMTAQKLYESGQITYMRTDSVHLSDLALNAAKAEITESFGSKYSKSRQFATNTKGAQEAHEAIRPTYFNKQSSAGDASQKRLYDLIWKRSTASQMADAELEKTVINIEAANVKYNFVARGEVIIFDGFLKLYTETSDNEDEEVIDGLLPKVSKNEALNYGVIEAIQRFTKQPPRYTEASLVKKMEELGIGRPSTYAPTISTIIKRNYVVKEEREGKQRNIEKIELKDGKLTSSNFFENYGFEKNKLFPTDIGILVNSFLMTYFSDIIDYQFTANVEKEFDLISDGKNEWNAMIKEFYVGFRKKIEETKENSDKFSGERFMGIDQKTGKNIYVKLGKYGPIAQIGETTDEIKPRFAGLNENQSLKTISLEEVIKLFDYPKFIGKYNNFELNVAVGRFGPYIKMDKSFFSIPKSDDPSNITLDRAIELITAKQEADKNKLIQEFSEEEGIKVLNGRFGPYISFEKNNYKIDKTKDPKTLTLEDCKLIIGKSATKKKIPRKKKS